MSFALNVIAKTSALLICAIMLSPLLKRASASTRHAVWAIALVAALFLPLISLLIPQIEWPLPQSNTSVRFLPLENSQSTFGVIARDDKPDTTYRLQPMYLWLLGAVAVLVRFGTAKAAVRRLTGSAAPADADWHRLTEELREKLSMRQRVQVLLSTSPVSPMTWGLCRHTIVLPSQASDWAEERRRLVLAHELAHVKRKDGVIQVLAQIACSLYWFNPLTWYAAHRIRIERERACDDQVLNLGADATDYADHLIQIVRTLRPQRALGFAAISMAQPSQLETRVLSILDSRIRRTAMSKISAALILSFVALVTVSIAPVGITAGVPLPPVFLAATKPEPPSPPVSPVRPPQRTRIGNAGTAATTTVTPPRILESTAAGYTPGAILAKVEGTVTLEGTVDVQGRVSGLHVIKGLNEDLDRMAIKAVLQWKFSPALRNGAPVQAITQIEVDFKIPENTAVAADTPLPQDDAPPVRMGAGVSPPTVLLRVEPQYTPEARDAKQAGTVVVQATVHQNGSLTVDNVVRGLDYGLTENAILALQLWKFRPGMKDGKAVPVTLNVEVNFNLK
jgi:TonB family protein